MEYIEREAVLLEIKAQKEISKMSYPKRYFTVSDVLWCIRTAPAVDVEQVVHGKWIIKKIDNFRKYEVTCSNCGWVSIDNYDSYNDPSEFKYCPHCGAKMDLEGTDHE